MIKTIINGLPQGTILHGKSYDYEIVKALGQGSFGITYLASVKMRGELGSIDATVYVAIKEFFMHEINGRDGLSMTSGSKTGLCEKYKKKFIAESKNLSKLKNSHIIKVVESFAANDTVYYVMEYIDGKSLDEHITDNGSIPEKETLKIASQTASAVSFMHSKNMLHLDLKPSNVMMRGDEDVVLIDFGLSKQFDENGDPESSTTIGGGTPGYSPLEQSNYSGDASSGLPVTMDVYALGATIFKMLTGHKPPVASGLFNDGFPTDELLSRGVGPKTISLVESAMQPQRGKRVQTMQELKKLIDESLCAFDGGAVVDGGIAPTMGIDDSHGESSTSSKRKNYPSSNNISSRKVKVSDSTKIESGIKKNFFTDNWIWTTVTLIIAVVAWILITHIGPSSNEQTESDTAVVEDIVPVEQFDSMVKQFTVADYSYHNSKGQTFSYSGTITSDSIPTGSGTGVYSNGVYKGDYRNGLRHGKGTFDTSDGQNHFIGTFANDLYENGTLTLADGMYFRGIFKSGSPYSGKWDDKDNSIYSTLTNGK